MLDSKIQHISSRWSHLPQVIVARALLFAFYFFYFIFSVFFTFVRGNCSSQPIQEKSTYVVKQEYKLTAILLEDHWLECWLLY